MEPLISTTPPLYDVLIVGAGITGATAALACAQMGLAVALVESNPIQAKPFTPTLRVSTLTANSHRLLSKLGVWEKIAKEDIGTFQSIQVWDEADGQITFDWDPFSHFNAPGMGFVLENEVLLAALHQTLLESENISCFFSTTPLTLEVTPAVAKVTTDSPTQPTLFAYAVIGADGIHSWVRTAANITLHQKPYGHHALIATIETELSHQKTAWQHFLSTGPLAFLPFAKPHQSSIVWSAPPEIIQSLIALEDEPFREALHKASDQRLGRIIATSARQSFPLIMRQAQPYVKSRVALIGDAAHTFHPLAGQGANLGLIDAAWLAEVLMLERKRNRDIGKLGSLRHFTRRRLPHHFLMQQGMAAFQALFALEEEPYKGLRARGMQMLENAPRLKRSIMDHAAGLTGDLPEMMQ